jgi:hypothetical protein
MARNGGKRSALRFRNLISRERIERCVGVKIGMDVTKKNSGPDWNRILIMPRDQSN